MNDYLNPIGGQIDETATAIRALEAPAVETAVAIDQAFSKAGESMARSLARAASDGKISLRELASALLSAVNAASGASSSSGGLGSVLAQIFSSASSSFSGGGPRAALSVPAAVIWSVNAGRRSFARRFRAMWRQWVDRRSMSP